MPVATGLEGVAAVRRAGRHDDARLPHGQVAGPMEDRDLADRPPLVQLAGDLAESLDREVVPRLVAQAR